MADPTNQTADLCEGGHPAADCRICGLNTGDGVWKVWCNRCGIKPMATEPQKTLTSPDIFAIANQRATEALAQIADRQMRTWDRFPSPDSPMDIITRAIVRALEDAGVKANA